MSTMSRIDQADRELRVLMAAACDGTATADDFARLEERLENDPPAQRLYFDYCLLDAELQLQQESHHAAQLALDVIEGRLRRKPRRRQALRRVLAYWSQPSPLSLTIAAGVIGLLVAAMAVMPPLYRAVSSGRQPVADVIAARDVQWAPSALVDGRSPSRLFVEQSIELLRGTVVLRFSGGALVLLEGPVKFAAQGPNGLHLQNGKLAARVPAEAAGFLVSTPTVEVIDLGTEFSLVVSSAEAEVQVLTGKVTVRRSGAGERATSRLLAAGEAIRFHSSSSEGFVAEEQAANRPALIGMMAQLATADGVAPPVIGYWQFQDQAPGQSAVTVASALNSPALDGVGTSFPQGEATPVYSADVVGPAICDGLQGPIVNANNSASLQFTNTGSAPGGVFDSNEGCFVFVAGNPLLEPASFTYEGFLKIFAIDKVDYPSILSKGTTIGLHLNNAYKSALAASADGTASTINDDGKPGQVEDARWHHFALTFDGDTNRLNLYLDYKLVHAQVIGPLVYDGGGLGIGDFPGRAFHGFLDEIRLSAGVRTPDQFLRAATSPQADSQPMTSSLDAESLSGHPQRN